MTTTMIAALACAVGLAAGVLLILAGLRPTPEESPRRPPARTTQRHWGTAVLAAGGGVAAALATGWVVAAVVTFAGVWFLPRLLGPDRVHTHRMQRIGAIASWTEMLRDTLAASAGLEQALHATAATAPAPIAADINTMALRLRRGDDLTNALTGLADDLADPTADLVLSALVLAARDRARQLGDLLSELASEAREQVAMRLRVEAGRARTRTSVRVIVATTVTFAVGLVALNRGFLEPYNTATGQLVLALIGALFAAGLWWLNRIAVIAEPDRVLSPPTKPSEVRS